MQKKLISSVVTSAVAMAVAAPAGAAKPNAREGLDNPLDEAFCSYQEGGFIAGWYDPNDEGIEGNTGDTKYGGDIEFDALLQYTCDFAGTEAEGAEGSEGSETAIVDVDLSRDESDPFSYFCEGAWPNPAICGASISQEDVQNAIDEAAAARFDEVDCSAEVEDCVEICTEPFVYCEEDGAGVFPASCFGDIILTGEGSSEYYCEGEWSACDGEVWLEGCGATEEQCSGTKTVEGNFHAFGATLDDATFSVKEMNPGHGNGKQNYEKVYAECNFP